MPIDDLKNELTKKIGKLTTPLGGVRTNTNASIAKLGLEARIKRKIDQETGQEKSFHYLAAKVPGEMLPQPTNEETEKK